jgi:hypothetical protein
MPFDSFSMAKVEMKFCFVQLLFVMGDLWRELRLVVGGGSAFLSSPVLFIHVMREFCLFLPEDEQVSMKTVSAR